MNPPARVTTGRAGHTPAASAGAGQGGLIEPLTERELDVVRLAARGRTNEELATELHVTLSTVKTHLANVQRKLAARNRVEIAAWAWENGICTSR